MHVILVSTLLILVATYVVSLLVRLVLFRGKRKKRRWYVALLRNLAVAVPVTLVLLPVVLGYAGSRLVGTRPDEAAYQGPRIAADGRWLEQSRPGTAAR